MPTVTFCNELNDDKIRYPSYVPRATHRFTFDCECGKPYPLLDIDYVKKQVIVVNMVSL